MGHRCGAFCGRDGRASDFVIRITDVEDGAGGTLPRLITDGTPPVTTKKADRHSDPGNGWVGAVLNDRLNEVGPNGWFDFDRRGRCPLRSSIRRAMGGAA